MGLSHDGRNTAVFALASRSMRRLGLSDSHWGALLANGNGAYAHHPPLLVWLIGLVELIFGEGGWVVRLPTVTASVAVIWLLYGLLRDLEVEATVAVVAVACAVSNPMFLLYGWMADTPMLALPFALVATRSWLKPQRRGARWIAGLSGFACGLSGWQAVMWCGLLVLAGSPRSTTRLRRLVGWLAAGLGVGLAVTVGWIAASPLGVGGWLDSFATRAAGKDPLFGPMDSLEGNLTHLLDLWSPVVLVLVPVAAVLAWRAKRHRRLLAVLWVGVVGYAALFWQASGLHDYWGEWGVAAVAVTIGLGADRWCRVATLARISPLRCCGVVAVLVVALGPLQPSEARVGLEAGGRIGRLVEAGTLAPDQPGWLVARLPGTEVWISYMTDRRVEVVDSRSRLEELARSHPSWRIVLPCRDDVSDWCGSVSSVVMGVAVTTLGDAAAAMTPPTP